MEIIMGSQFSREFTFEDSSISFELSKKLSEYLRNKDYGVLKKLYIENICVSKGFEPFFKIRKPKILKEEPALEFEFKLDFDVFFSLNIHQKQDFIIKEFLKAIKEVFHAKKVSGFDNKSFINDLEIFFKNYYEN